MKNILKFALLGSIVLLSSCSTIFTKKTQKLNVFSNADKAQVTVNDSVYDLPAEIYVQRGRQPLQMVYQSAHKQVDTVFKAKHSPLFYLGNVLNAPAFGVGYIVDLTNLKRFKYKKNIFFNDKDSLTVYEYNAQKYIAKHNITNPETITQINNKYEDSYRKDQEELEKKNVKRFKRFNPSQGTFRFFLAPPTISFIGLSAKNPNLDQFSNFVGGVGFGLGGDYYYSNKNFVTLELSNRVNQFDDFWWSGHKILARKLDVSFRNGHRKNRFEYGYGISYTYTNYNYRVPRNNNPIQPFMGYDDDNSVTMNANYSSLGISTLFNYQLTSIMYIGVRYNPSIYSFRQNGSGFDYEHVIGFDYRIKF